MGGSGSRLSKELLAEYQVHGARRGAAVQGVLGCRGAGTQGCRTLGSRDSESQGFGDAGIQGPRGAGTRMQSSGVQRACTRLLSTLTSPPHCALQDLTFLTKQEILQ